MICPDHRVQAWVALLMADRVNWRRMRIKFIYVEVDLVGLLVESRSDILHVQYRMLHEIQFLERSVHLTLISQNGLPGIVHQKSPGLSLQSLHYIFYLWRYFPMFDLSRSAPRLRPVAQILVVGSGLFREVTAARARIIYLISV